MTEARPTLTTETLQVTVAPELSQNLTELQITAVNIYLRGLNVIPIPHPAWLEANGHPADDKTPFILTQFYTGRLNYAGLNVRPNGQNRAEVQRRELCRPV